MGVREARHRLPRRDRQAPVLGAAQPGRAAPRSADNCHERGDRAQRAACRRARAPRSDALQHALRAHARVAPPAPGLVTGALPPLGARHRPGHARCRQAPARRPAASRARLPRLPRRAQARAALWARAP